MPVLFQALALVVGILGLGILVAWWIGDLFTDQLPIVIREIPPAPNPDCPSDCSCRGKVTL